MVGIFKNTMDSSLVKSGRIMKKPPNPTLFLVIVLFIVSACGKPVGIIPQAKSGNKNIVSVIFFGITINPNSAYRFDISQITQPILDSGSVSVYFRNSIVIFDTWYPLPYYSVKNDSVTSYTISEIRVGSAKIENTGTTEASADYRFDIAPPN
jgi:hypothetical protein